MHHMTSGLLGHLTKTSQATSGRFSSHDTSGKNQDYWMIGAGDTVRLADIQGPGCITHLWMTQFCRRVLGPGLIDPAAGQYVAPINEINNALGVSWEIHDPDYYRKVLLKIYWDDQTTPSVLVPLGDFFCVGHGIPATFTSLPFTVSVRPEEQYRPGGTAALNCYLPMPFNRRAIIEVENQNDVPYGQYFHIDYEQYPQELGADTAYFHASWRREAPCAGWAPELQVNSPEVNIPNLDGANNYVILDIEGEGHYIGCNLSVAHAQGTWWGEGDDMIFVDDDTWPPTLVGTGSEDYFNHAWGMQENASLMNGCSLHDAHVPGHQTCYRFHLTDPVHFKKRIRVTMEHGHANHLADDWATTAYWYQTLPSQPVTIQPVEERLPGQRTGEPQVALTPEMQQQKAQAQQRFAAMMRLRQEGIDQKLAATRQKSALNRRTK
ncbi:glycoside hydrolase family 172 protein [Chimaeribacter arupi]|uniref:glycoside hydrolase family 172 protein n=1 Tax=Chimaeribacter arupi TaxID=2060066 RepID=UPI0019D4742C|nr:glycoside hydrolase family 172 protein [Chimaeribacter arupi]